MILQKWKFYIALIYLAGFCCLYLYAKQHYKTLWLQSSCGTCAFNRLKGKLNILNQWCMHGRNIETFKWYRKK